MSSDWREAVLVLMARVLAAIALLPVLVGLIADPSGFLPFLPLAVALVAAAIWAGWSKRLSVASRSWLMSIPLAIIGSISAYRLGPNVGVGLILAVATIVIGLVRGPAAGYVALALTAICLATFGIAGHLQWSAYVVAHQDQALYWLRSVIMYAGATGVLLLFVTRAVRRVEHAMLEHENAEAQLRAQSEKLDRALERSAAAQATLLRLSMSEAAGRGDLAAAVREITSAGVELLDVERCGVWFLRNDATLECIDLCTRSGGGHESGEILRADAYPAYFSALLRQRTVAAHDALRDERTRELGSYLVKHGIASMLDSPIHAGDKLIGVVCHEHVGSETRRWSSDEESHAGSLADCAARALYASERARAEKGLRRAYDQLARVTWRMEAAKEDERRHIARELHDELGQSLTAIKLNLKLLGPAVSGDPTGVARLEETGAIVDDSIRAMRELSRAMRPPLLDEVGLVPALQAFVDEQARRSAVDIRLSAPMVSVRRAPDLEIAAFRIVQEAVTNVLRHAEAHTVLIELGRAGDSLDLVVRDDGRGFDADEVFGRIEEGKHMGLVGMRERARALGGSFDVSSGPGQGTEIRVVLPVPMVGEAA